MSDMVMPVLVPGQAYHDPLPLGTSTAATIEDRLYDLDNAILGREAGIVTETSRATGAEDAIRTEMRDTDAAIRLEVANGDADSQAQIEAVNEQIRADMTAADTAIRSDFSDQDTAIRTEFRAADAAIRADMEAADAALHAESTNADAAQNVRIDALEVTAATSGGTETTELTRIASAAQIAAIGGDGTTITIDTAGVHQFLDGDYVEVRGCTVVPAYNDLYGPINKISTTQITMAGSVDDVEETPTAGYAATSALFVVDAAPWHIDKQISVTSDTGQLHTTTVRQDPDLALNIIQLTTGVPSTWIGAAAASAGNTVSSTLEEIRLARGPYPSVPARLDAIDSRIPQTNLTAATDFGATALPLAYVPPHYTAGTRWVLIDRGTLQAEIRKTGVRSGTTVTVPTLNKAHAAGAPVEWMTAPIWDVTYTGTVLDGTTGSQEIPYQAALADCHSQGGGMIYHPPGTAIFGVAGGANGMIGPYSNQMIYGVRGQSVIKRANNCMVETTALLWNNARSASVGGSGAGTSDQNIVLDGLTFDGGKAEAGVTSWIGQDHMSSCILTRVVSGLVRNCTFINGRYDGLILEECYQTTVEGCVANDNVKNGFYNSTSDYCTFVGCHAERNGSPNPTTPGVVTGTGGGFAIAYSWYNALSGCTARANAGYGLETGRDSQHLTVNGGSFDGFDVSAETLPVGFTTLWSPNHATESGPHDGVTTMGAHHVTLNGMQIVGSPLHDGIRFFKSSKVMINNCIVSRAGRVGIKLHGCWDSQISGGTVRECGKDGTAGAQTGILIVGDDTYPVATNNVVRDVRISDDQTVPTMLIGVAVSQQGASNAAGNVLSNIQIDATIATKTSIPAGINVRHHNMTLGTVAPVSVLFGTTPPTSGTWLAGAEMTNTSPLAGTQQPLGWRCITGGSPGTWQAFGPGIRNMFTLTDAASVTPDCALGDFFLLPLTIVSTTLTVPSNAVNGQRVTFVFKQDASGNRNVTFSAAYLRHVAAPVSIVPNAITVISFVREANATWWQDGDALVNGAGAGRVLQSGITGSRPSSPVQGQEYFDTTLHKPIYFESVWKDATGTAV